MAFVYSPPSPHGHFYYEASQLTAFGLYVALLLTQGRRRGYAWRSWLPLVAASTLALVLGCQLVFLPAGDWLNWLAGRAAVGQAVAAGPRSIVGGAVASLLVVLALRRIMGFRGWAVLDAFAGPLCWALAVQCVGCVLVGCCWGEVAAPGSWGLVYGPGTAPYAEQLAQGLLASGARHALPVVPTQLLHLLLCAGTGLVLHLLRRRAANWPGGSRYLLSMGLLCLGRFGVEFWRDPAGEPLLAAPLELAGYTLEGLQWLLLLAAVALLGGWAGLVRWAKPATAPALPSPTAGAPALVGLGLLAITAQLPPGTLRLPELLVVQALLLLVLLAEAQTRLRWPGLRLAGLPLGMLLALGLLGGTAQMPALPQQPPPEKSVTISGGVLGNYHEANEEILENNVGCSGKQPLQLQQRVRAGGAEVAFEKATATRTTTWGGGLWLGQQHLNIQTLPTRNYRFVRADTALNYLLSDVHVYREMHQDDGWMTTDLRLGVHMGNLGYYSYFDDGNSRHTAFLMPEVMLRLGKPETLYAQADFCYGAENTLGACTSRLALGSGLGQARGSRVLAGYAHSAHQPTPHLGFVSATVRLPAGTGLQALSLEPYFATDFGQHTIFSMKLGYRLAR